MVFRFFIFFNFLSCLAFLEFSSLSTHFRPFTEVMRKSGREVTREMGKQPRIAQMWRMRQPTFAESLLLNRGEYLGRVVLLLATYRLKGIQHPWLYSSAHACQKARCPAAAERPA